MMHYHSPLRFVEDFISDREEDREDGVTSVNFKGDELITLTKSELTDFARKLHNKSGRYWKKRLLGIL